MRPEAEVGGGQQGRIVSVQQKIVKLSLAMIEMVYSMDFPDDSLNNEILVQANNHH